MFGQGDWTFASFFYFFLSIPFFCVFVHIDFVSVNKKAKKERKDLYNTCLAILTLHLVNLSHLCRYCVCPTKPELRELFVRKGYITITFYSRTLKTPSKNVFLAGWACERGKKWSFLTLNGTWAQVTIEGISFHANHVIQVLFLAKQCNSVFVSCDESALALLCRRHMAFSEWVLVLYSFFVSKAVNNIQKVD